MRRLVLLLMAVVIVIVAVIVYGKAKRGDDVQPPLQPAVSAPAAPVPRTDPVVHAVPASPQSTSSTATPGPGRHEDPARLSDEELSERVALAVGRTPPIDPNQPGVSSVVDALKTGTHPERLSLAHPPSPFDPVAFAADPQAYCAIVEPGRVFQAAKPAADVPALQAIVDHRHRLRQGEQVELAVVGAPSAPVTFTSLDLGTFAENGLASVTVRADERGEARVRLRAGPGTEGEMRTLAASPMASGTLRFIVEVVVPLDPALTGGVQNN